MRTAAPVAWVAGSKRRVTAPSIVLLRPVLRKWPQGEVLTRSRDTVAAG